MSNRTEKKWVINGSTYQYGDIPGVVLELPLGVYQLNWDKMMGFSLQRMSDNFLLPDKVYDSERTLIERVKKTFNGFNKNFGILLKGLKGTGKTITGKQISNELELPVILVNNHYPDMGSFINSINQNVILFFDEFEKTYEFSSYSREDDEENTNDGKAGIGNLLTLMDGVFTSKYKRLFILTTNKEYMPDAIMSRPSRIRYVKDFTDISYEGIMEILSDIVTNKELIPQLVAILKGLKILTVDIVKAIAEEAELYNTADVQFFSLFNIDRDEVRDNIYVIDDEGNEELLIEGFKTPITSIYTNRTMHFDGMYITVTKVDQKSMTFSARESDNKNGKVRNYIYKRSDPIHSSLSKAF